MNRNRQERHGWGLLYSGEYLTFLWARKTTKNKNNLSQLPWKTNCINNVISFAQHLLAQSGLRRLVGITYSYSETCWAQAVWTWKVGLCPRKTTVQAHVLFFTDQGIRTVTLAVGCSSHTGREMPLHCDSHSRKSPAHRSYPKGSFCSTEWHSTCCWEGTKTATTQEQKPLLPCFHAAWPWMYFLISPSLSLSLFLPALFAGLIRA